MSTSITDICLQWHDNLPEIKRERRSLLSVSEVPVINTDDLEVSLVNQEEAPPKWISSAPRSHLNQTSTRSLSVNYGSYTAITSKIVVEKDETITDKVTLTRGNIELPIVIELTLPEVNTTIKVPLHTVPGAAVKSQKAEQVSMECVERQQATATITSPNCCYIGRFTCCLQLSGKVTIVSYYNKVYDPYIGAVIQQLQDDGNAIASMFTVSDKAALWRVEGVVEKRWHDDHTVYWT